MLFGNNILKMEENTMKKALSLVLSVVMVLSLILCSGSALAEKSDLEPVTLKMWFHGSTVSPEAS